MLKRFFTIFWAFAFLKIISRFEWSDYWILDDFLEDHGLCFYMLDGPLVAYPPSFELFMYTICHLWLNFFRLHEYMEFNSELLTTKEQLYGHYICILDMQMVTLLGIYEKLLDLQLINKMPLDQGVILQSTLNLLNELDILIKLRMDILFAQGNILYKFNLNTGQEDILFQEYVSQWDIVHNNFKNFFKENIIWSEVPKDLKLDLSRWESGAYYDDKYYEKFIKSNSFANHFDKYKFLRKIPHNLPYSPWNSVCSERFLEVKAQWDLHLEKVRNN